MSDARTVLAEWQQRTDAATEGPWFREYGDVVTGDSDPRDAWADDPRAERIVRAAAHRHRLDPQTFRDAEFIVTAREAMPKLLAALRAIEALCNDPYAVEFIEAPEDGVLVSDIRQAINDALGTDSGSER